METATPSYPLHPLAVILPSLALIIILLDLLPLIWHVRHRNVGSTSLIVHLSLLNLKSFINPLIWPRDNIQDWFNGNVLCDIEVRLHLFASFGIGTSLICIFKGLAHVLDPDMKAASLSSSSKRKRAAIELLLCFGMPLLFIIVYYVVQSQRYAIFGISGCAYIVEGTWVSIVLVSMWFPLLQLIAAIYSGLVIYRLVQYSPTVSSMLQNHQTSRARFYRTFFMSFFMILVNLPAILYIFVRNFPLLTVPYDWTYVHADWNIIYGYPSNGSVDPNVWGSLAGGAVVFCFFGTGQDALKMYRGWLVRFGAGRLWPSLLEEASRDSEQTTEDHWHLLGKVKGFFGTWSSRFSGGHTSCGSTFSQRSETVVGSPTKSGPSPLLPIVEAADWPLGDEKESHCEV